MRGDIIIFKKFEDFHRVKVYKSRQAKKRNLAFYFNARSDFHKI